MTANENREHRHQQRHAVRQIVARDVSILMALADLGSVESKSKDSPKMDETPEAFGDRG